MASRTADPPGCADIAARCAVADAGSCAAGGGVAPAVPNDTRRERASNQNGAPSMINSAVSSHPPGCSAHQEASDHEYGVDPTTGRPTAARSDTDRTSSLTAAAGVAPFATTCSAALTAA